jgi:hypothetical protein
MQWNKTTPFKVISLEKNSLSKTCFDFESVSQNPVFFEPLEALSVI